MWVTFFLLSNHRWVLCTNHTEPVRGFLGRFLRRKLIETEIDKSMRSNDLIKIIDWIPKTWQHLNGFLEAHSSSDVTIGQSHTSSLSLWPTPEPVSECGNPVQRSESALCVFPTFHSSNTDILCTLVPGRSPSLPVLSHGRRRLSGLVHRPVELLPGALPAGGCQGGAAGTSWVSINSGCCYDILNLCSKPDF